MEPTPTTQIKNETSTRNIEPNILSTQISKSITQIPSTELIPNTQTKNDTTTTETVEEKEQTTNIKTETISNTKTDVKIENEDYATNKIDTINKLSNISTEYITSEISKNIPTDQIDDKIQPNATKTEKTEIIEKHASNIAYNSETIPSNTNIQISRETNLPIDENEAISVELLGFSNVEMNPDNITFSTYFVTSGNKSLPIQ